MADALFVQILDAIVGALNTDRPLDVPEVTQRRILPEEPIKEARMGVFLGDENVDPPRGNSRMDPIRRPRVAIAVQCVAPADDVELMDKSVAPMLAWATSVLAVQPIPTALKGLAHYLIEQQTLRRPYYVQYYVMNATQIYQCSYQTRRHDLTVPA